MTVWVVVGCVDYEGDDVLGVFSDEPALEFDHGYWLPGTRGRYYDYIGAEPWEVK